MSTGPHSLRARLESIRRDEALSTELESRLDWTFRAACIGLFDLATAEDAESRRLVTTRVCPSCPVRKQCLELGLELSPTVGVWGGYDYREIRKAQKGKVTLS